LTKHDVLRHASAVVKFAKARGFEQNLDSLFEGTTHQRTGIVAVDSVTSDGHQKTTLGHDVDQQSHVTMINIRTIERQHHSQLVEKAGAGSFDTQYPENLDEGVRVRLHRIHAVYGEHISQGGTSSIEHPFLATRIALG
jgi:hypothetical protein